MRVAFLWCNRRAPIGISIGVAILAGELRKAGHHVHVVHWHEALGEADSESIAAALLKGNPELVCVSFGSNQAEDARLAMDLIRRAKPNLPILAGGIHPTLAAAEVLSWGSVNYVFVGEADGRMVELAQAIIRGADISGQPNIATRKNGVAMSQAAGALPDIDQVGLPDWDAFSYRRIAELAAGFVNVIGGRGCPFRCTYCHNSALNEVKGDALLPAGKARRVKFVRMRSVENLLMEMRGYRQLLGSALKNFNFGDDMAVADRDWLHEFADRYPREFDVPFSLNATLNFIDDDIAATLARAGCSVVRFGLESGSERLRVLMRRPDARLRTLDYALGLLRARGLNSRAYVMVGIPTETPDELFSTFELAGRLQIDTVRPSIFYPYPGTPLHALCVERDLIGEKVYGDYFSGSVLRWADPAMEIYVGNIVRYQTIFLNAALPGEAGTLFRPLRELLISARPDEWLKQSFSNEIQAQGDQLSQMLRLRREVHYVAPVPNRPELTFLLRERTNRILNIDWSTRSAPALSYSEA